MAESLDRAQALLQAGGNEKLAKDLFQMLLAELPEMRNNIEEAWRLQDATALRDHAHKISGATAYCGVPELATCARSLEDAIKMRADRTTIEFKMERLSQAIDTLLLHGPDFLASSWS